MPYLDGINTFLITLIISKSVVNEIWEELYVSILSVHKKPLFQDNLGTKNTHNYYTTKFVSPFSAMTKLYH